MVEFYTVPIWECCSYFLGVPLPIRFWGSKLSGELVDESYCEIEGGVKRSGWKNFYSLRVRNNS